jgi:hypothetical protein
MEMQYNLLEMHREFESENLKGLFLFIKAAMKPLGAMSSFK